MTHSLRPVEFSRHLARGTVLRVLGGYFLASLAGSLTMYLVLLDAAIPSVFLRTNDLGQELWAMLVKTSFVIAVILIFHVATFVSAGSFLHLLERSKLRASMDGASIGRSRNVGL
jgi:hypothetical protein